MARGAKRSAPTVQPHAASCAAIDAGNAAASTALRDDWLAALRAAVAAAQADVAIAAIGHGNATRHHRHQRAD